MNFNYEDSADAYERQMEAAAKEVDDKIIAMLEKGAGRKLTEKEKDWIIFDDYASWYDKYTGKKDAEYVKITVPKIKNGTLLKENYFPY